MAFLGSWFKVGHHGGLAHPWDQPWFPATFWRVREAIPTSATLLVGGRPVVMTKAPAGIVSWFMVDVEGSIVMGVPQNAWFINIYKGKSYQNGWFGGTPILVNHHVSSNWRTSWLSMSPNFCWLNPNPFPHLWNANCPHDLLMKSSCSIIFHFFCWFNPKFHCFFAGSIPIFHRFCCIDPKVPCVCSTFFHPAVLPTFDRLILSGPGSAQLAQRILVPRVRAPVPRHEQERRGAGSPWSHRGIFPMARTSRHGPNIQYWLVVWLPWILFSHILGISSSQLTSIFQRGGWTTNQN